MAKAEDYDEITKRIMEKLVDIPEDLDARQLMQWLKGYAKAQNDVIEIIMDIKKSKKLG